METILILGAGIIICIYGLFALLHPKVYDGLVFIAFASINLNTRGADPAHYLIPAVLILGIIYRHLRLKQLVFPKSFWALLLIFLFFYFISIFVGTPSWVAVLMFLGNLSFFFLLKLYLTEEAKVKNLFFALLFGHILTSLVAFGATQKLWLLSAKVFFPVDLYGFSSFLGTRNVFGWFTASLWVWLLDETLHPRIWKGQKILKILLIVFGSIEIIASWTRSVWIGLVVAILVYFVLEAFLGIRVLKKIPLIFSAVVVGTITFSILGYSTVAEGIITRRVRDIQIERFRVAFGPTRQAIPLAADAPFGIGPGATTQALEQISLNPMGPHNFIVQILVENGWISTIAFLGICGLLFVNTLKYSFLRIEINGVSFQMLLSGLVFITIVGFFHDLAPWNTAWLFPSIAAALLWRSENDNVNQQAVL